MFIGEVRDIQVCKTVIEKLTLERTLKATAKFIFIFSFSKLKIIKHYELIK